jgi:beta-glucosidase-like glycosyl hydrolase
MNSLQRAASFVIHRVDADSWSEAPYRDRVFSLIEKGIGGIGVFAGDVETTVRMIEDCQRVADGRLIVGADFEHGLAMRLRESVAFPRAMALGRLDPLRTRYVAGLIASQARAIGVHWIWAPVCDVQSNPLNPIVGTRAFGSDVNTVGQHVQAWVEGCQEHGVMACGKHVPGHGDTHVDSHVSLPSLHVNDELATVREFPPFVSAINAGVKSLMIGHLLVPFLDDKMPASLSHEIITGLVRLRWGFDGIVVTDALDMGAITNSFSSGDAAVAAFLAGADGILMPSNTETAIFALASAIEEGEVSNERLLQSEDRWVEARTFAHAERNGGTCVTPMEAATVALSVARDAMEVSGETGIVDLRSHRHAVMLAAVSEVDVDIATTFFRYVAQSVETDIDFGFVDGTMTDKEATDLALSIRGADVVYIVLISRPTAGRPNIPGLDQLPRVIARVAESLPRVSIVFGDPQSFPPLNVNASITMYSETDPSLAAAALRCAGRDAA